MKSIVLSLLVGLSLFAFMSEEQIKKEFMKFNEKDFVMVEKLSNEALERFRYLRPANELVSDEELKAFEGVKSSEKYKAKGHIDRRACDNVAMSQCGPVCTSHGLTNAMDNTICNPKKQNASNMDLWNKYRKYSSSAAIRAAKKYAICDEKDFPNCGKIKESCYANRHIKLLESKSIGRDVEAAKRALDNGHALNYAGKVTRSWVNCDAVVNPHSSALSGGHAVAIVGYKDEPEIIGGGYFIILNSWGKNCGNKGYQYLPYHYCNRKDNGMYCYMTEIIKVQSKHASNAPDPVDPQPIPQPICKKVKYCKRLWHTFWIKKKCYYKTVCK